MLLIEKKIYRQLLKFLNGRKLLSIVNKIKFAQIQYNILRANLYVSNISFFSLYPQNINMEPGVQAWEQQANHFSLEYRANST